MGGGGRSAGGGAVIGPVGAGPEVLARGWIWAPDGAVKPEERVKIPG